MTGRELIERVRELLRDEGSTSNTTGAFFSDEAIIAALVTSRTELARELIFRPNPARLTISKLLRRVGVSAFSLEADRFLKLEAGIKIVAGQPDRYVPVVVDAQSGPAYFSTGLKGVYVQSNAVYGDATDVYYWSAPVQDIIENDNVLTEFTDGFYYAVRSLAVLRLLAEEQGNNLPRWAYLDRERRRCSAGFH